MVRKIQDVSHLLALVDDHKARHGQPSDSSIARAVGIAPQTLSSWRKRGLRELPEYGTLQRLAEFLHVDYEHVVLRAALIDTGWLPAEPPTRFGEGQRGRRPSSA